MTEGHAERLALSLREYSEAFDRAEQASDWDAARKVWYALRRGTNTAISEARGARIEADALAAELLVYRPTRAEKPAAPLLPEYCYVFTANFPWVCAAKVRRDTVLIQGLALCPAYAQEHYTPEKTTACGKKTSFPVSERFTSGGWPRLHELCPDCVRALGEAFQQAIAAKRKPGPVTPLTVAECEESE